FSASVSVKDGKMTGGTISPNSTVLNTSIQIGALGGGSTVHVNNIAAWQTAIATYLFNLLNTQRSLHGVGPMTLSAGLQAVAMNEANYEAYTGMTGHIDLQGAGPHERASAMGMPLNGENSGWG